MAGPMQDKPVLPGADTSLSVPRPAAPAGRNDGERPRDVAPATEESDVWWGSYAGRAMLPGFLVCLVLTILLLALDWYLESRRSRSDLLSSAFLSLAGAIWLFQGTRWLYRILAINYRLTNRRLMYTQGFNLPETWAIDLAHITEVSVKRGPLERLLGVGRITIQVKDADSSRFVLDGVLAPEHVARTLRRRVRQVQALRGPMT
jgi:membrane protein YdbS with pleckstrin-like domain